MRISGRSAVATGAAIAVVLVVGAVLLGMGRQVPDQRPVAEVAPAARAAGPVAAVRALVVLRDWDRTRAAAWAHGDVPALRRLYAAGSAAGRDDVALLRRWSARGLRVRGMSMQLLGVRLEVRTARRIVLVVTDRLVTAYAVGHGRRYALPRDNASTRRLDFRRVEGRWVLRSSLGSR
ncbi:hypothetical protein GCM10028801_29310 [Nocardioides maradonensis]